METVYGWDYHWPAVLDRPFLISNQSYVEHLGRDLAEGGLHCPNNGESEEDFRADFQRDRAVAPTESLIRLADQALDELLEKL
jgi:hypothetical protein